MKNKNSLLLLSATLTLSMLALAPHVYAQDARVRANISAPIHVNTPEKNTLNKTEKPHLTPDMLHGTSTVAHASSTEGKLPEKIVEKIDRASMATTTPERSDMRPTLQPMIDRIQATINREQAIKALIVSRIGKIKATHTDTHIAEGFVTTASLDFDQAQHALNLFESAVASSSIPMTAHATSTTSDTSSFNLKKISDQIQKYIRDGHGALEKATGNLRTLTQSHIRLNATTTSETHN